MQLNGPSSAGKSTLAAAFARRQPTPWRVFPVDLLHSIRSRPGLRPQGCSLTPDDWRATFRRTRAGYHRALAGLAEAGNDVVADHVLNEAWRLDDLLEVTVDVPVLLVHVTASPEDLTRREASRGDRDPGVAVAQLELVFRHSDCDLEIDTSVTSTAQAVEQMQDLIANWPDPTAFDRLRQRPVSSTPNTPG